MENLQKELQECIKKTNIFKDEPMKNHTSLKVGGTADYFIKVTSIQDLKFLIKFTKEKNIPLTIVGNGTNLLVTDKGIRGIVAKLEMNNFKIEKNKNEILFTAEAGLVLPKIAAIALKEEFTGIEFLSGIPGTIGGAIRMNAGAYGKEMKDVVVKTRYLDRETLRIKTLNLKEHEFEYRNSVFSKNDNIILETTLRLEKGNKHDIKAKMDEYMVARKEKQPLEYQNAGSTFKRKGDIITAKLIDECGLKGESVGDAYVSDKHAGFIVNKGKATATDILELIEKIQKVVKKEKGIDIELEVLVLGEK